MVDRRRRYSWRSGLALAIAVAVMGFAGFLISRASGAPQPVPPTPRATQNPSLFGPQSTGGFSAADDGATGQVVVFGGIQDDQATWLWNGTSWDLAAPKISPPGRLDAAMAYDPALHLVLLFGGHGAPGTDLHDTWAWGGVSWRELDSGSGAAGTPAAEADMAWDAAVGQMVLIAAGVADTTSATWVWAGTQWTHLASGLPTTPANLAVGFDPSRHQLVAVGLAKPPAAPVGVPTSTWVWSGSAWREVTLHGLPIAVAIGGVAWDPVSAQFLLFADQPSSANPSDIWSWNGNRWVASDAVGQPILEGTVVTTNSSLLLVGALDSTGLGAVTRVSVFSWSASRWRAA